MIRLEMTAVDKVTGLDADGNNTVEITRQVLFMQEWQHGDGPHVTAVIALVNDLLQRVCQCSHRKEHHTEGWNRGACMVAGCNCQNFQDPAEVARQRAAEREIALERKLATVTASEALLAKQLLGANKLASDRGLEARRARESAVRAQAKLKAARGSAAKKGRRR